MRQGLEKFTQSCCRGVCKCVSRRSLKSYTAMRFLKRRHVGQAADFLLKLKNFGTNHLKWGGGYVHNFPLLKNYVLWKTSKMKFWNTLWNDLKEMVYSLFQLIRLWWYLISCSVWLDQLPLVKPIRKCSLHFRPMSQCRWSSASVGGRDGRGRRVQLGILKSHFP